MMSRTSLKASTHEGACSRNTLPGKYPNQYTQKTRRGSLPPQHAPATRFRSKAPLSAPVILAKKYVAQQNFCYRVLHVISRQANFSTQEELAPETDLCNKFAPGAASFLGVSSEENGKRASHQRISRNV